MTNVHQFELPTTCGKCGSTHALYPDVAIDGNDGRGFKLKTPRGVVDAVGLRCIQCGWDWSPYKCDPATLDEERGPKGKPLRHRNPKIRRSHWTADLIAKAYRLREAGKTTLQIARELEFGVRSVRAMFARVDARAARKTG